MEDKEDVNREYEFAFLVRDESAVPEILQVFKRSNAEIDFEGPCRRVNLAYPIGGEENAYFGFFHFKINPEIIQELDKEFTLKKLVLRHLFITPPIRRREKRVMPVETENAVSVSRREPQRTESLPLSNEELERKIGEILQ